MDQINPKRIVGVATEAIPRLLRWATPAVPGRRPIGLRLTRCWPSSASASASPTSTCSSSMSACRTSPRLQGFVAGGHVVGPETLCDRLCGAAGVFGRLAERHARNSSFLLGIGLFTAASAACSAANNVEALVAFRVLQAAGAALDDADLAGASAGGISTRSARQRGSDLGPPSAASPQHWDRSSAVRW